MTEAPFLQTLHPTGRVLFIGDLHGCYAAFVEACEQAAFDPGAGDIIVSVGDLIDRGPDSLRCLALLNEPWFHAVRGNHESLAINALHEPDNDSARNAWVRNGGQWYFDLPDTDRAKAREMILGAAQRLPYALDIQSADGRRFGVIHAELPDVINEWDWPRLVAGVEQDGWGDVYDVAVTLLWSRGCFKAHKELALRSQGKPSHPPKVAGVDALISGHTVVAQKAQAWGNWLCIDGGAYKGNPLTLLSDEDVEQFLGEFSDWSYQDHGKRLWSLHEAGREDAL